MLGETRHSSPQATSLINFQAANKAQMKILMVFLDNKSLSTDQVQR